MRIPSTRKIIVCAIWILIIFLGAWIAHVFSSVKGFVIGTIGILFVAFSVHQFIEEAAQKIDSKALKDKEALYYTVCFLAIFFFSWLCSAMVEQDSTCGQARTVHFNVFFGLIAPSFCAVYIAVRERIERLERQK